MATTERPLEGEALERTSLMSMFSKEWNNCYWALQGNLLLLYPNKEAYLRNPSQSRKMFKLSTHMHVKDVASKPYKVNQPPTHPPTHPLLYCA